MLDLQGSQIYLIDDPTAAMQARRDLSGGEREVGDWIDEEGLPYRAPSGDQVAAWAREERLEDLQQQIASGWL